MIKIDTASPVPIYDQIKAGLRGLVTKGLLKPGDAAPSIRSLAAQLKVNPNTVARAFRELATEGFFENRRGGGNIISRKAEKQAKAGLGEVRGSLQEALRLARRAGLGWQDIESIIRKSRQEES